MNRSGALRRGPALRRTLGAEAVAAAGSSGVGKFYRSGQLYSAPDEIIGGTGIGAGAGPATGTLFIWPVGPFAQDCTIDLLFQASSGAGQSRKFGIWTGPADDPYDAPNADRGFQGEITHPTTSTNPAFSVSAGDLLYFGITYGAATDAYLVSPVNVAPRLGWNIPGADAYGIIGFTKAHAYGGDLPDPLGAVTALTWDPNTARPVVFWRIA